MYLFHVIVIVVSKDSRIKRAHKKNLEVFCIFIIFVSVYVCVFSVKDFLARSLCIYFGFILDIFWISSTELRTFWSLRC